MKLIPVLIVGLLCLQASPAISQKGIKLSSPDGSILYSFRLKDQAPIYNLYYKGKPIVADAPLGLSFQETGTFQRNLKMRTPVFSEADEQYELTVGKTKTVNEHYKQVLIPLEEKAAPYRKINLVVRAFNDGLAFRYEFPEQKTLDECPSSAFSVAFYLINLTRVRD